MTSWLPRVWVHLLLASVVVMGTTAEAGGWDPWRSGPAKSAGNGPIPEVAEQLPLTFAPLFSDGSATAQSARLAGRQAPPTLRPIALMADFADSCFYGREDLYPGGVPTSTQSAFYYAAHDSIFYAHLLTDVRDFYAAASGERFDLDFDLRAEVPLLEQPMGYYGNHPEEGEQPVILARDVIAAHDAAVDFSSYDTVFLIHPGAGEETDILNNSPEQIYSTYLGPEDFQQAYEDSLIPHPYLATDDFPEGEGVRHVLILPENEFQDSFEGFSGYYGSLGVYCFEVGLRLGMLSLTDFTPSGSPDSQGIGQFGLMGYGLFAAGGYVPPQPCAFNKQLMGWLDPYLVDPIQAATWTLLPSEFPDDPQACARVDVTGAEYFLLEYRLQDPDGNVIFSFTGDLNGNNTPDFWDASNPPSHVPAGFFDPAEDQREWFTGAEWDFFLSDNSARADGVKGAGSGVHIWHIDEGVIRDAFGQRRNLFNANPDRKSVDLEEADGIQDLDTRQPSPWWLGGDFDSYRAENNDSFAADTRPDTRTNGGVPTGLAMDAISNVVVDSFHVFNEGTDAEYTGILYAGSMTFRCRHDVTAGAALQPRAALDLPGVDMTGAHLMAVPTSDDLVGSDPLIVAAADAGRVYALTVDLEEWVDHDADPETVDPLVVGVTEDGAAPVWLQPAAAGQFDGTDAPFEIVVSATDGVYAFGLDGSPLSSGPGAAVGRVAGATVVTPAVLLSTDRQGDFGAEWIACVGTVDPDIDGAPTELRFIDRDGQDFAPPVALGGHAVASPTVLQDRLFVPLIGHDGSGRLQAVSYQLNGPDPAVVWTVDLDLVPTAAPCAATGTAVMVRDDDGRMQSVFIQDDQPRVESLWPADVRVLSPLGVDGTCLGDGVLGRVTEAGAWQHGWPRRPMPTLRAAGCQPLTLDLGLDESHHLFATLDGRLYLTDRDGRVAPGWPAAAPADLTATPVIVSRTFENADGLVVAAAATTPSITGVDAEGEVLETTATARLRTWTMPGSVNGTEIVNAMYGGRPERGGGIDSLAEVPSIGRANLAAHHVCYPQPLTGAELRVRGWIPATGTARAVVLNLQGEKVRDTGAVPVAGGQVFELPIDMSGVASGVYVCTLQAGGETSVKSIAVAR